MVGLRSKGLVAIAVLLTIGRSAGWGQVLGAAADDFSIEVLVRGLNSPRGLAIHPISGEIYVAEKGANRVVVLRNNKPVPVIEGNWRVDPSYPKWAITRFTPREALERGQLQAPGSLAFSTNGTLFVAEHVGGGRILEFIPDETGQFRSARLVAVPWLERPYIWEDLKVARDGRLFVVGKDSQARAGLTFGVCLMRDLTGDWWIVDFGPFMDFSGVYLSRKQDIVVITERPEGGLVWWDAVRRLPIGMAQNLTPQSEIEAVALLNDGSIVLAQRASTRGRDARLLRLDPTSGALTQLASGFDSIGGVILQPETGKLLLTDSLAGLIAECAPKRPMPPGEYLLQRSLEGYEVASGFTPRTSPDFLRNFFSQAGVGLDQPTTRGSATGTDEGEGGGGIAVSVSLRDFASRLPLVAGKVKVVSPVEEAADDPDPIEEMNFVLLFPGRMVYSEGFASPSFSFFAARRRSGKVEQTRELFQGMPLDQYSSGAGWKRVGQGGTLTVPLVTCSMQKREEGVEINMAFLGLGLMDDYYLSLLSSAEEDVGTLVVTNLRGERRVYKTTFREVVQDGSEVKNLVVAGFDPKGRVGVGWLNIGQWPVGAALGQGEMYTGTFQGISDELARLIQRKQMEWRSRESGIVIAPESGGMGE